MMDMDLFPVYCSVCDKQLNDVTTIYCSSQCKQADSSPRINRHNSTGLTTISATLNYPSVLSCTKPNCLCGASTPLVPDLALSPSDDELSDYSMPASPELPPANNMNSSTKPLLNVDYFSLTSSPITRMEI